MFIACSCKAYMNIVVVALHNGGLSPKNSFITYHVALTIDIPTEKGFRTPTIVRRNPVRAINKTHTPLCVKSTLVTEPCACN